MVYPDMYGSENHWRGYCNRGVTTLVETHWKKRYNILISSVPSDRKSQPFTVDERITTHNVRTHKNVDEYHWYDAKKIYESLPDDAKKCKYPIVGVVHGENKFALRAPENRKFYQTDQMVDIFVLG